MPGVAPGFSPAVYPMFLNHADLKVGATKDADTPYADPKELDRGTLRSILQFAGISPKQFTTLLK